MNIRDALSTEHSKRQTMAIVKYVGGDPTRFAELMKVFLADDYRSVQRASWPVNYCVEAHPEFAPPYFAKLLALLERDDIHSGAHRNILRMLQFVTVPPRHRGRLYDICIGFVDDPSRPVATRVFALEVAARIAAGNEHLLNELRLLIEKHAPHSTAALRARARRIFGGSRSRSRTDGGEE